MNNKAQAMAEMAIFGSLILFIFGTFLSHLQRFNDQQYVDMEAFRRALEKATTYQGQDSEGAGASVQYSFIENRKHTELQGGFRKGNTQTLSASSNVFWAVPKVGRNAENLIVYRINQDEVSRNFRNFVPKEHDRTDDGGEERQRYWEFEPGDMSTETEVHFDEREEKQEDPQGITNRVTSDLRERNHVQIPYRVVEKDKDDKDYEDEKDSGILIDFDQHLYRDTDGQYKFSELAPDAPVIRGKQWQTDF